MKKIALILILSLLLSFGMSILVSAEEYGVTPRYSNIDMCRCFFDIQNDIANARVIVNGLANVTSRISVKVTLEKRALLGLIWTEKASFEASSTEISHTFDFATEVKSGTYRCNFEITVTGNNGTSEVITEQITATN